METQPHLYAPLFHAENTARIWYAQWNNVRPGKRRTLKQCTTWRTTHAQLNNVRPGERRTVYGTTYGLAYER
jgi:hypothetical protein